MAPTCAIWLRTSKTDQHPENQRTELERMANQRGLEVVAEFAFQDSASDVGKGNGKGTVYDSARKALLAGAHRGDYAVVLCWALDRLSRRGYRDLDGLLRQLARDGCEVHSIQEPWLATTGPFGEIVLHMLAWIAEQESVRRSERVRAGLERRKAAGLPVGRQPGALDKTPRKRSGYVAAWEPGGTRRASHGGAHFNSFTS